jgi:CRISPR-associated protein Csc2
MTLNALQPYQRYFVSDIPRTPTNRYASIILMRETKSYAIFTTEGGEQQDVEQVPAGLANSQPVARLVMFKRKQVAPERRTGKALLRQYGVFPFAVQNGRVLYGDEARNVNDHIEDCHLTANLCTHCPDCLIYGYAAVEGEGARRARVMTDTCFTIRPYETIQKQIKFNVIDEAEQTSGTITEYDYTVPGVFLPSVETTVDLTADEFTYVLGNILRTTRYGKEGSRQGFVRNHILAIAFSDVELFANLEFTQALYDALLDARKGAGIEALDSLTLGELNQHVPAVLKKLTSGLTGRCELITGDALAQIIRDVQALNQDEARLAEFLRELNTRAASFSV